jgi:hypothetical protein
MWIKYAWETIRKSYVVWLGQLLGWLGAYMGVISSDLLSEADKVTFHVAAQLHYIPIVIALFGIFGIAAARAIKQPNIPTQ